MPLKANSGQHGQTRPPDDLVGLLRKSARILVVGHQNPDGDAVGSALALAHALISLGKTATVGLTGSTAASLDFLLKGKTFVERVAFSPSLKDDHDLLVLVDCQAPYRVWPEAENKLLARLPPFVVVDHHHPGPQAARHHLAAYVNSRASATAELVFKIVKALGAEFSKEIVDALLAGLISDTGSFSQGNATSECLRQASELVALGGDIERVNHFLKRNWPASRMRLLAASLGTLTQHLGGRLAAMLVTQDILNKTGAALSETEGLVEYPLMMTGVEVAALLRVNGQLQTKVSLRSRSEVDVRKLAQSMGGGGHKQAAAYVDDDPDPAGALARLVPLVAKILPAESDD